MKSLLKKVRHIAPMLVIVALLMTVTSAFALTWTSQTSGTTYALYGVTHGGTQLVTVGYYGTILTSPDGTTWTSRTSGTTYALNGVTHGGTQLVTVGYHGTILTSPDGTTWTSRTSNTTHELIGVAYDGTQFVAVGSSGTILTSPDGTTWTSRTSGTTNTLHGVAHDGTQFVAVGSSGTILTSPDGTTWTSRTSGTTHTLHGVAHDGTQVVAVGQSGTILTSPDGTTWTSRTSGTTNYLNGVTYGGTQFVAVGRNGTILTSPDGVNWTADTSGTTQNLLGVVYDGTQFVAAGNQGTILTSVADTTPPSKTSSVPADGASYASGNGPTQLTVTFDEDVKNDGSAGAANTIANYLLVEAGVNGAFDTATCFAGVATDDTPIAITNASYTSTGYKATLTLASALPSGKYRLFVCGTTSIEDLAGNKLNGGANDSQINFTVDAAATTTTASSLPKTGFRHGQVTTLAEQPAAKAYTATAMTLEIPKLGVSMPIVGVPQSANGWDVSWLGNSAGYLAGSAFPTWAGNTVITGHVWDAYNNPGIFADLKTLDYGDQIQIQAWGETYTYEVRESKLLTKKNVNAAFQSEQYDWVTLVTCEFYNPFNGEYLFRRAVRAVLVNVE